jgi:hypothetical protein
MDILEIDVILLNILNDVDLEFIYDLLLTNKHLNEKITKYYKNGEIVFSYMPLFRPCNNITTYLKHYKSYISGKDFPDEPLWIFENETDCKYVECDNKYIELENVRFEKPKFFNYFTSYKFLPFKGGLYHWKKLTDQQKYLVWCAISGTHPEIKLDKTLMRSDNLAILLSEIYWHYQKSFVRFYLEIYCIDTCDLLNAKCIASNELISELEHYRGNHFIEGYKNAPDKKIYIDYYFDLCHFSKTEDCKLNHFRFKLLYMVADNNLNQVKHYENLHIDSETLLKEIIILDNITDEINEFEIIKINNLKTYNINYLDHMSINYPSLKNLGKKLTNNMNENCIQQ